MNATETKQVSDAIDETVRLQTAYLSEQYGLSVEDLAGELGVEGLPEFVAGKRDLSNRDAERLLAAYRDFNLAEGRDLLHAKNRGIRMEGFESRLAEKHPDWLPRPTAHQGGDNVSAQDVEKAESMSDADLAKFLHGKGMI